MKNLIIGASGKIGKYFLRSGKNNYIFTYNNNKIKGGIKFNILNEKIEKITKKHQINGIVILSAYSDPDFCIKNKKKSNFLNVVKTKKLIKEIKIKSYFLTWNLDNKKLLPSTFLLIKRLNSSILKISQHVKNNRNWEKIKKIKLLE